MSELSVEEYRSVATKDALGQEGSHNAVTKDALGQVGSHNAGPKDALGQGDGDGRVCGHEHECAHAHESPDGRDLIRIVAFDFDGTVLEGHSPVRMVRRLVRQRIIPGRTALATLWWGVRYRLRMAVEQAEVREYIFRSFSHFLAVDADTLMADFYTENLRQRLRPRALETIRERQAAGEVIVLVSASFFPILREARQDVGADWFICTQMEVKDGYYTGNVAGLPPEGEQKVVQLVEWADERYGQGAWEFSAAYGDHHSDEPMLRAARCAVAVNPDNVLERVAKREGWRIVDWSMPRRSRSGRA
jgi:HAD superfamily hydrolase (TIGR01490 family)